MRGYLKVFCLVALVVFSGACRRGGSGGGESGGGGSPSGGGGPGPGGDPPPFASQPELPQPSVAQQPAQFSPAIAPPVLPPAPDVPQPPPGPPSGAPTTAPIAIGTPLCPGLATRPVPEPIGEHSETTMGELAAHLATRLGTDEGLQEILRVLQAGRPSHGLLAVAGAPATQPSPRAVQQRNHYLAALTAYSDLQTAFRDRARNATGVNEALSEAFTLNNNRCSDAPAIGDPHCPNLSDASAVQTTAERIAAQFSSPNGDQEVMRILRQSIPPISPSAFLHPLTAGLEVATAVGAVAPRAAYVRALANYPRLADAARQRGVELPENLDQIRTSLCPRADSAPAAPPPRPVMQLGEPVCEAAKVNEGTAREIAALLTAQAPTDPDPLPARVTAAAAAVSFAVANTGNRRYVLALASYPQLAAEYLRRYPSSEYRAPMESASEGLCLSTSGGTDDSGSH